MGIPIALSRRRTMGVAYSCKKIAKQRDEYVLGSSPDKQLSDLIFEIAQWSSNYIQVNDLLNKKASDDTLESPAMLAICLQDLTSVEWSTHTSRLGCFHSCTNSYPHASGVYTVHHENVFMTLDSIQGQWKMICLYGFPTDKFRSYVPLFRTQLDIEEEFVPYKTMKRAARECVHNGLDELSDQTSAALQNINQLVST